MISCVSVSYEIYIGEFTELCNLAVIEYNSSLFHILKYQNVKNSSMELLTCFEHYLPYTIVRRFCVTSTLLRPPLTLTLLPPSLLFRISICSSLLLSLFSTFVGHWRWHKTISFPFCGWEVRKGREEEKRRPNNLFFSRGTITFFLFRKKERNNKTKNINNFSGLAQKLA